MGTRLMSHNDTYNVVLELITEVHVQWWERVSTPELRTSHAKQSAPEEEQEREVCGSS